MASGEVRGYQWQMFDLSMVDPWRVKMIGQCAGEIIMALVICLVTVRPLRAYAVAWAGFFGFRLWLELNGNPTTLMLYEATALLACMSVAFLNNLFEIKTNPLRVVHRSWT